MSAASSRKQKLGSFSRTCEVLEGLGGGGGEGEEREVNVLGCEV